MNSSCPLPAGHYPRITMAHGGGGRIMHRLIEETVASPLGLSPEHDLNDAAVLALDKHPGRLAFTTDSYVVRPLFFPGGDIGSLSVHGTVNDLAMMGAQPLFLSLGFILEEGFSLESLKAILQSIRAAADAAEVRIVTGDTKVVDRGKGDGLYINTSGIGVLQHDLAIRPGSIREGDAILLNGDVGRHGMAIMAVREGLAFESEIRSDSAPLAKAVQILIHEGLSIHCMRDCTRGGMATTLNELATSCHRNFQIEESRVPVRDDVAGACELLGLDAMYVANEGRFVMLLPEQDAPRALEILREQCGMPEACQIGQVQKKGRAGVHLKNRLGALRVLDMLSGEQLPRIC